MDLWKAESLFTWSELVEEELVAVLKVAVNVTVDCSVGLVLCSSLHSQHYLPLK